MPCLSEYIYYRIFFIRILNFRNWLSLREVMVVKESQYNIKMIDNGVTFTYIDSTEECDATRHKELESIKLCNSLNQHL